MAFGYLDASSWLAKLGCSWWELENADLTLNPTFQPFCSDPLDASRPCLLPSGTHVPSRSPGTCHSRHCWSHNMPEIARGHTRRLVGQSFLPLLWIAEGQPAGSGAHPVGSGCLSASQVGTPNDGAWQEHLSGALCRRESSSGFSYPSVSLCASGSWNPWMAGPSDNADRKTSTKE